MEIALRIWNFDSCCAEMFADQIVEVAFETARAPAHFVAPNDELEVNCAVPELLEERVRRRITQRGRMLARRGDERFAHLDRKSTRLNSSHEWISYAVFCLKKKI